MIKNNPVKKMNSTKKTPVIDYNSALTRILLMIIAIIIGMLISVSSANAATKVEKSRYSKSVQKRNAYSCDVLKEKKTNSSNKVVKVNSRRPKWR
ncbi:MAG TPA: hypothetical protein VGK39_09355 [Cyclobacteriaceae bacterium]